MGWNWISSIKLAGGVRKELNVFSFFFLINNFSYIVIYSWIKDAQKYVYVRVYCCFEGGLGGDDLN